MPEDEGPVSFGYELTRAIGDVREALRARHDAAWELSILGGLLKSWARESDGFVRRIEKLEDDIIRMVSARGWGRPMKPSWQVALLGEYIDVARQNGLLDVSERPRPPRGKELIEPVL